MAKKQEEFNGIFDFIGDVDFDKVPDEGSSVATLEKPTEDEEIQMFDEGPGLKLGAIEDEEPQYIRLEEETLDDVDSFLLKIGGRVTNERLFALGTTVDDIKKFQLIRLLRALAVAFALVMVGFASGKVFIHALGLLLGVGMWFFDYMRVANEYSMFQFKRQLDFNKFIRMLMPYLQGKDAVMYKSFEKMRTRIEPGTTKTALIGLMTKMNTDGSIKPFEEFAEESSGQDRSLLIMQTLYDYHRSSNDSTTINELSSMVDSELQRDINEVIEKKDLRFEFEYYILAGIMIIPMFGYFISMMASNNQMFGG